MAVYELLEQQMIMLATILGILAALCGFMAFKYGKLKSYAEEVEKKKAAREMKWTDENKNVAAIRFTCYNKSEDLNYLHGTLNIIKKSGGIGFENGNYNVLAKESEIYLPIGNYHLELSTREFKNSPMDIYIQETNIGERLWYTFGLEKKDTIK